MIDKIKAWFFEGVILRKVVGKFVKHGITVLAGLLASKPFLKEAGVTIDWTQLEAWATVAIGGLAGAAWNYIEHRFVKKQPVPAK